MKKKILISTGGSGGHVIPAMVFYDHLKEDFDIFMTVDERGSKFINHNKYKFDKLSAPRITKEIIKIPITLISLITSIIKFFYLLKKKKIDILIGTGGYMSFPACVAAKILNLKIYLFEPNMLIGRANKILLNFCNKIFCYSKEIINLPQKKRYKIILLDHLLRHEIYNLNYNQQKSEKKINLLIIGGSQGANFFDNELKSSIVDISKKCNLKVYHQVSDFDLSKLELFYKENNIKNILFNFEENIYKYMSEATFAITRAGAMTLSELAYLQVPFIAIPFKYAKDNHQLYNAFFYKNNNCCWILEEKDFDRQKLTEIMKNIVDNNEDYVSKKNNLKIFSYKNNWNNINQKIINLFK